jgi:tripartite motif-containing protein 71
MVLPVHPLTGPGRGSRPRRGGLAGAALLLLSALLAPVGGTAAPFDRWSAVRAFDLTTAGGVAFNQPSDLAIAGAKLWVLDSLNNRLCSFDLRGRPLSIVRGAAPLTFDGALGLASDPRGRIFVADGRRERILALAEGGGLSLFAELPPAVKGKGTEPAGLLFYNDRLYHADNEAHRVGILSAEGRSQGDWGGLGEGPGLFKYPFRLAVDPRGRIGVTDVINARIQFFTPKGEFLTTFGTPGSTAGTLFRPGGLDIDDDGDVWVADNYFGTIQVFDVSGTLRAVIHDRDGKVLTLGNPTALKYRGGVLYVVEMRANRVSAFTIDKKSSAGERREQP